MPLFIPRTVKSNFVRKVLESAKRSGLKMESVKKCSKSESAESESVEKCSKSESVEPKVQVPKVKAFVFFLML